jgi:hypothetical protein
MRGTTGRLLALAVLAGLLAGCGGYSPPKGTLTADEVSDHAKARKSKDIEIRVHCGLLKFGETTMQFGRPTAIDEKPVATVFELNDGKGSASVESSVWKVPDSDMKKALERLESGIDACVEDQPEDYSRIDPVPGYPRALGYEALTEWGHLRRFFVPIDGYVVVVGALRDGRKTFPVEPEGLLKDAVKEAKKLDH